MLIVMILSVLGCPGRVVEPKEPASSTRAPIRAKRVAQAERGVLRYHADRLERGHGYQVGQIVALYGEVEGQRRALGVADVVVSEARSVELVAWWVDPSHLTVELELAPFADERIGERFARIAGNERGDLIDLDIGADAGVFEGALYSVLSDVHSGGPTPRRRTVGLVHVIELGPKTASARILRGTAEPGAHVVRVGYAAVPRRPEIEVVVARFEGAHGRDYSAALHAALEQEFARHEPRDVRLVERAEVVSDEASARAAAAGADAIVWGRADSSGSTLSVAPTLTLIDSPQPDDNFGDSVINGQLRAPANQPEAIARDAESLAAYLAGVLYFSDVSDSARSTPALAAGHLRRVIASGTKADVRGARLWQFYCIAMLADDEGALEFADALIADAKARKEHESVANGLLLRSRTEAALGMLDDALAHTEEALEIYTEHFKDPFYAAVALTDMARVHHQRFEFDEALQIRRDYILPVLEMRGDTYGYIHILGEVIELHVDRGDYEAALAACEELLTLAEELGEVRARALSLRWLTTIHYLRGELSESERSCTELLALATELDDLMLQAQALGGLADLHVLRGELGEALRLRTEQELPVARRIDDYGEGFTLEEIAEIHLERDDYDEALRIQLERLLPIHTRLDNMYGRADVLTFVARVARERGQLDQALRVLEQQVMPLREIWGDRIDRADALAELAEVHRARGALHEALRIHVEERAPVYEELRDTRQLGETYGEIATIYAELGNFDEALRIRMEDEIPIYLRHGDAWWRLDATIEIAKIYRERGELDEAMQTLSDEVLPELAVTESPHLRVVALRCVADIHADRGELDEAIAVIEGQVIPLRRTLEAAREIALEDANLAKLLVRRDGPGDRERASTLQAQSAEVLEQLGVVAR